MPNRHYSPGTGFHNPWESAKEGTPMKRALILTSAIIVLFLTGATMVPRAHSNAVPGTSGWIDIMPQPSFRDWTRVAIPPERMLAQYSQWSVDAANRTLVCAGDGGHEWLRYGRELGDFLFRVEWRLAPHAGVKGYNSGVFVRNNDNGSIWYQAQVGAAGSGYWFGYDNPAEKGPIGFNLKSQMMVNAVKPAGEWNSFDIRCQGAKLELRVNGTTASEFDQCRNLKGYLGLEAEGSRIEFRNMRIKVLK
jgi:3-keto-disaccharide hydrolase